MTPLLPAFVGTPAVNRVYQVDALTLLAALPDKSIDIVVTSPPYNLQRKNRRGGGMMKKSKWLVDFDDGYDTYEDDLPEDEYQQFVRSIVSQCLRVSKGLVWVNHKTRFRDGVGIHPLSFMPFPFWSEVIWNRGGSFIMNSRRFAPSHEFIYGFGTPHYWNDDSNKLMTDWRIVPVNKDDGHPCPYPEQLVERLIEASCPLNGVVFDPFMGSGTTGAVAQRMGRRYLGCDVSLEYCELARKRIEKPYTVSMFPETEGAA